MFENDFSISEVTQYLRYCGSDNLMGGEIFTNLLTLSVG